MWNGFLAVPESMGVPRTGMILVRVTIELL